MSSPLSEKRPRIGAVLVQHDRKKYPRTLPRLFSVLSELAAEPLFAVVDNAVPGDWEHRVSGSLVHLGGDNAAWEFSAFDRGVEWLAGRENPPEVYILATDALLAYGDEVLRLVDDRTLASCRKWGACIGWVDSFMQTCRILDYRYDAWLRTSLLFLPAGRMAELRPLSYPIDDGAFFSDDPESPFRPDAPLSDNLSHLIREWLTSNPAEDGMLDEVWHSQFALDRASLPRFRSKAKAILREHLLSARLARSGVPCFDFRAIDRSWSFGAAGEQSPAGAAWHWLGWKEAADEASNERAAEPRPARPLGAAPDAAPDASAPTLLLPSLADEAGTRAELAFFEDEVLPLLLQRFGKVRVKVDDGDGPLPELAVACLLPRRADPPLTAIARSARRGIPPVGTWRGDGVRPADGRHYLRAETPWQYAAACCRMIDEPELRAALAREASELTSGS